MPSNLDVRLLTRGASGYNSLLGNLSVCLSVCVSLDRQNPHLVFKTLQNQYTWASYDTLEKTHSEYSKPTPSKFTLDVRLLLTDLARSIVL